MRVILDTKLKILTVVLLIVLLSSCRQDIVYTEFRTIARTEWRQTEVLNFEIDSSVVQLDKNYEISIIVDNTIDYHYSNIVLFIESDIDSEETAKIEKLEYQLADASGNWYGNGFAFNYSLELPYRNMHRFEEGRNYNIRIHHAMTDSPLHGIERIGLKIKEKN